MLKRIFAASALLLILGATAVHAQDYPPASNSIVTSSSTVAGGGTIIVTAKTYAPGTPVTFTLLSTPAALGTANAGSTGVATLTATIPADTTAGAHHIRATGIAPNGTSLTQDAAITVTGATTATTIAAVVTTLTQGTGISQNTTASTVAKTGTSSTVPMTEAGIAAIAAGGFLVLLARRRRAAAPATAR